MKDLENFETGMDSCKHVNDEFLGKEIPREKLLEMWDSLSSNYDKVWAI